MSNKRSTFKRMLNKMKNYTRKKEQKKIKNIINHSQKHIKIKTKQ